MIRLVEGDATTRAPLAARLSSCLGVPGSLCTSRLTRLECRSKPLRAGDMVTLAQFDVFFAGVELVLVEISATVVERATELRARYARCPPFCHGHRERSSGVLDRRPCVRAVYRSAGGNFMNCPCDPDCGWLTIASGYSLFHGSYVPKYQ